VVVVVVPRERVLHEWEPPALPKLAARPWGLPDLLDPFPL
jgi:hypothetical protein